MLDNNNQINETNVIGEDSNLTSDSISSQEASQVKQKKTLNCYRTANTFQELIRPYCVNCTEDEVCIKTAETKKPRCVPMADKRDATGTFK